MLNVAFKEWAIVVDAIASGRQIFILRKGGLHEGKGGFKVEHREFLFFPTQYHQQRENVIPEAQQRYDQIFSHAVPEDQILISHFARIEESQLILHKETLEALEGQHVWKKELLDDRFEWGPNKGVFALLVRTFKLPCPRPIPMMPDYGGCKSWIQLNEGFETEGAIPVLSDEEFSLKSKAFHAASDTIK